MSHSSTYLLRPTIWMSRADLDRLRAADARDRADTHRLAAPVAAPVAAPRTTASDASGREQGVLRCAAVGA